MAARTDWIEALLKEATAAGEVPGVVVAAAFPDGEIISVAAGTRDMRTGSDMRPDSVVWIASMTKAITAAAAMKLVEQGKIALDEPVSAVLPRLGDIEVLVGFGADGAPILRPAARPITLRHLLSHTSGFALPMWNAEMARYRDIAGIPNIMSGKSAALDLPLAFDPGTAWAYGINFEWAAKLVGAVSGKALGTYMAETFFDRDCPEIGVSRGLG